MNAQESVNARIRPHIPSHAWLSTVAIVAANRPAVYQIGSGTLFQIADSHFLVTAGHVIRAANRHGKTIGLADTGSDHLIGLTGEAMCSVPREGSDSDPYDVAVLALHAAVADKLSAKRFLRIGDVSFADPGPKAVFTIFGYPGLWSKPIQGETDEDRLIIKPLEFTTYAYDGDTTALTGYEARLHLLLAAGAEYATNQDGSVLDFRDRFGQPARLPIGLKGISGCSVWHVGDLAVPIERWADRPAAVVGVETGVYQSSGVITASRWAVVTTLIHEAFPNLRRSIEVWT
jgi:hypothetical protein